MNDRERFERAADLFLRAGKLPGHEVGTFLDAECGGDNELRRQVADMLGAADDGTAFRTLAQAFASMHAHVRREAGGVNESGGPLEHAGQVIGRYKLVSLIGEGGFGRVWIAEQLEPVTRRVALKVIKAGMDTRQVVARFEQERQALALMDHPGIAKVFDAGATEAGRPFFVMELCVGDAISVFCDKHNLPIPARLDVARQVCAAVQHAHTKGVIHRDLKPSNVLVSMQDGAPVAKVIDFGIAKATARLTESTVHTEMRQMIGTPQYMSPEQAEGSQDIDTRTDIYSLGVILYELLTGATPFRGIDLQHAAQAEIQRIIAEVEPPKPSTRLVQSADTLPAIAACRGTEASRITSMLRGELDWIVMKALEKDRARRYDTAGALADDLRRFLTGEEVAAAPPSRTYTFKKFVRRNRGPVAAGGAIGVLLIAGLSAFAWQASVATRQRDRAVMAEDAANARADELRRVAEFQAKMLAQADPAAAGVKLTTDVRARFEKSLTEPTLTEAEKAERAAAFAAAWGRVNATDVAIEVINATIFQPSLGAIGDQFADNPRLEAKLRSAIGERYLDLGLYEEASRVDDRVVEMLRASAGEDDPETIAALLARCKLLSLRAKPEEAEKELRAIIARHQPRLGAEHALILSAMDILAETLLFQSKNAEAEPFFVEVLKGRRRTLGDDHPDTMTSISNLSRLHVVRGNLDAAEALSHEAMERRTRVLGPNHRETLTSHDNYGELLLFRDKPAEALVEFRAAYEGRRRLLGEVHPHTLQSAGNVAIALSRVGNADEAEAMQRETLEQTRKILGPDHPDAINALCNLVTYLLNARKTAEAEPLALEAVQRRERVNGPNHHATLVAYNVASILFRDLSRPQDAETYLRKAVETSRVVLGEDHPDRIVFLINFGSLERDLGKAEDAAKILAEAVERSGRTLGQPHLYTRFAKLKLAEVLDDQRRPTDVIAALGPSEADFRAAEAPANDDALGKVLMLLGTAHGRQNSFVKAEKLLLEAHAAFVKVNPASRNTTDCTGRIVDLYAAWAAAEPGPEREALLTEWKKRRETLATPPAKAQTKP